MTNKFEELIAKLCPNGVEYKKTGDIADVKTGKSNGNEAEEDGLYPFFVRSENIKRKNDWEYDEEAIIIPGEGGVGDIYHYIKGKYALHQRVYRVHFEDPIVNTRFAYYYFKSNFKRFIIRKAVSATVTSIRKPMIEDFEIPVPPLEVQEEIVRILDTFTELTAELTAELTDRKKQYEYYRDTLLTFDDNNPLHSLISRYCPNGVEYHKTSDLVRMSFWLMPETPRFIEDGIPYITSKNVKNGVINFESAKYIDCEDFAEISKNRPICEGDMLITMIGTIGEVAIVKGNTKFYGQNLYLLRFDKTKIINKYYYYFITSEKIRNSIISRKNPSSQGYIKAGNIENLQIPVPPLEVQNQIVQILDRFDALCNDLTQGLPAEIEVRRKQYEYYRDQLLTFKRA